MLKRFKRFVVALVALSLALDAALVPAFGGGDGGFGGGHGFGGPRGFGGGRGGFSPSYSPNRRALLILFAS